MGLVCLYVERFWFSLSLCREIWVSIVFPLRVSVGLSLSADSDTLFIFFFFLQPTLVSAFLWKIFFFNFPLVLKREPSYKCGWFLVLTFSEWYKIIHYIKWTYLCYVQLQTPFSVLRHQRRRAWTFCCRWKSRDQAPGHHRTCPNCERCCHPRQTPPRGHTCTPEIDASCS